ncbi:glycosyltransferase family 2 protein [Roseomonas sp. CCTCC AB2023176]|uniref:glycosyltransferase family 2 protein n=1 Tax=Roseomonas sp. CCTCC AB2023176 TaxID=3342640 RepID=UPI0035D976DC
MTPRFSVVMPAYNRADLIRITLESILAQTLPPGEVIVVDDGSKDDTAAVAASFGDRVRVERIANSGDVAARNRGIPLATGDLLAFCDSDDLWQPGHLAAMARLWEAEPRTKVAYSNFRIVRNTTWEDRDKFADAPEGYWNGLREVGPGLGVFDGPTLPRMVRFQPFFPSAMVARADVMRDVGGWDEAVNRSATGDFGTALRMSMHPPIGVVMEPTVGIRKHDGNYSGDVQKMLLSDARILEHFLSVTPAAAPHADLVRASIRERRIAALETAFARKDFDALPAVRQAIGAGPLSLRVRTKVAVASLPGPLRSAALRAIGRG